MNYYMKPVEVKAIQFAKDGSNYDAVIKTVELNDGQAVLRYLNAAGNAAPAGTITQYKGIALLTGPGGSWVPVFPGDYVVLNGEEKYAIPEELFLQYHVSSMDDISNGVVTFGELQKLLTKMNPPIEQVIIADKVMVDYADSAAHILKTSAIKHTDHEGKEYYVINGTVHMLYDSITE